jgi:hypothetical protein
MRRPSLILLGAVLCGLFAGAAQAKLTPAEEKWAKPLITIWNVQNARLRVVIGQATANNALVAGEKPENLALSKTLLALITCKQPVDLIKKAGPPPSPRLTSFRDALNTACIHDANGAHDFAKAVGAITKNNSTLAGTLLKQGVAEFKLGSAQLSKAYKVLIAVGGKSIFAA